MRVHSVAILAVVIVALAGGVYYGVRAEIARLGAASAGQETLRQQADQAAADAASARRRAAAQIPLGRIGNADRSADPSPRRTLRIAELPPARGLLPVRPPAVPSTPAAGGLSPVTLGRNAPAALSATSLSAHQLSAVPVPNELMQMTDTPTNTPGPSVASLESVRRELPPPLENQRVKEEKLLTPEQDTVKIVTGFECSTPLDIEKISPTHFAVRITTDSTMRNWFMFRVEGAKGKTVRIDIKDAPINKWWSLNPVYSTVKSLDQLSSFETNSVEHPVVTKAYNGPMLPDTSGQKWHYISNVWTEPQKNGGKFIARYCFAQQFSTDGTYVAMRVPYTDSFNEIYMNSLINQKFVKIINVGKSGNGRALTLVELSDDNNIGLPYLLLYAREHGSEQDSSWAVKGIIDWYRSDAPDAKRLRKSVNLIAIPFLDPDAGADAKYESITYTFQAESATLESLAYGKYFENLADRGGAVQIVLDLHNTESAESPHLFCMYSDPSRKEVSQCLHADIFRSINAPNLIVKEKLGEGYIVNRLGGWLGYYFGAVPFLYELNSQCRDAHLSVIDIELIGKKLAKESAEFILSNSFKSERYYIETMINDRRKTREYVRKNSNPFVSADQLGFNLSNRRP